MSQHNRIAGRIRDLDDLLRLHARPRPAPLPELTQSVNTECPLEVWVQTRTLIAIVEENARRLRSFREGCTDPEQQEINAALLRQREQALLALAGLRDTHLFMTIAPVSPDLEQADDEDAGGDEAHWV